MTEEKKIEIIRQVVLGRSLDDISIVTKVDKRAILELIKNNPKTLNRIRSEYIERGIPVKIFKEELICPK